MSLFARFLLLLVAFSLGPLAVVGVWVSTTDEMIRENTAAFHNQTAELVSDQIEQFAADLNRSLGFILDLERGHRIGRAEEFKVLQAAAARPSFVYLSVLDPEGREYLRAADPQLFPKKGYEDRSQNPLVVQARSSGRVAVGPVQDVGGTPVLFLAYPLDAGRAVYVAYSAERLWKGLQARRVGRSGRLLVADSEGRLMPGLGDDIPAAAREAWGREAVRPARPGWLERAGWVGGYRKTSSLGWYVLSLQPREEAYLRSGDFRLKFLAGLAGLGLALVLASLAVTRKLTKPLEDLLGGADRVSRSEFETLVPVTGWGKLKELAAGFNRMMSQLKTYQDLQVDKMLVEKAKVEALVNTMPDGVVLANLRGDPEYVNQLALSILHLTPSQVRGDRRPLHELLSPQEFRSALNEILARHARSQRVEMPEGSRIRYYRPKVVLCYKTGGEDRKGQEVGTLVLLQDITLEEELGRMKEEFFDSIVHDLRTPLSAIKGFLQLMVEKGMIDAQAKPFLPTIQSSCNKLQQLIQDILDVAKMESGEFRLKCRKVAAGEVLESMRALFQVQSDQRNIELRLEQPTAPLEFEADGELLERVVMNLIGNALKFTPGGGRVTVSARAGQDAETGRWTEFAVADTGPGIPQDKLGFIFEKFKQLDPETANRAGYGLGLSICKKVVELHGGRIWAESKVAQGTRFVLQFPSKRA